MIPGCVTRYHSILVGPWVLFKVVKIQRHPIGPKFIYHVDNNIEAILLTNCLKVILVCFLPNLDYRT